MSDKFTTPQPPDPNRASAPPRYVMDPLGNAVPVPDGMEPIDVVRRMQEQLKSDPQMRAAVMKRLQVRDAEGSTDPTDPVFRRAHLAKQVDGPVEPGDIDDFLVRADLARSDLATEKLAKLKSYFPDSEFHMGEDVDGSPVILYRHPGEISYREVESPEVSVGDLAALAGGAVSEDVLTSLLAFLGSRGTSLIGGMFRGAAGGAIGEGLKSAVEGARGYEHSTAGPITEKIITTGVVSGVGYLVFDPIARIINGIRGVSGLVTPSPSAAKAMQIAKDRDLPPLLPGQVHPVFESMQMQSAGTSQMMAEFQRDAFHKVVTRISDIRDDLGDYRSLSDDALNGFIEREEKNIVNALSSVPEMTFANAGRKVQKGLIDFQEALAEREARFYKRAFEMSEGVRFNLAPAQQIGAAVRNRMPLYNHHIQDLGIDVDIPLTPIETPAFRMALKELINLQPEVTLSKNNASPLEQMVRLRSTFINLADDDRLTGTERAASAALSKVLTEIMRNPRNLRGKKGNLKPSITRAWRQAASHSIARERFQRRVFARFMAASETPSKIARKLNPNDYDLVKETKRAMTAAGREDAWLAVQAAFKNNLLNNPARIRGKFKNWDKNALDLLVPPEQQKDFLQISDQWARLESSPVQKMLRYGTDVGMRAINLVQTGTRSEVRELITEAGGRDTPAGKALQAGIIQALLDRSTKVVKDRTVLDKESFLAGIKSFRDRGILDEVFDPDTTRKIVDDLETYVSFLPRGMGAGEGIQKASVAADVGNIAFPTPVAAARAMKGGHTLAKNRIIAWMFITPGARRFLIGSGTPSSKGVSVRSMGAVGSALAVTFDNMEDAARSGSFDIEDENIVPDIF